MEIWDLYDEKRQLLNKTHNRQEKMEIGEFHIVVEVWTVNDNHEILLTLRHPEKKDFPNLWENTGGSILAGESSKEGAVRELFEETGIIATENELFYLGTKKCVTAFFDIYMVRKNYKLSELVLQEGETVDAQWVDIEKFDEMLNSGAIASPIKEWLETLRIKFNEFIYIR